VPGHRGQYVEAVEVTRGPIVDSVHAAAIAVADATGRVVARLGGVDQIVYLRSSAKPFQTMAVVESGAAERFSFTPKELSVMSGSHGGDPEHVATVEGILARIGLDAGALRCGVHVPFSRRTADECRAAGRPFTVLQNNCSGKHAGMLAVALAGGHELRGYLEPSHPVQQRIIGILSDLTGRMRDRIVVGVDGCGAPTFGVSLSEAARAFARLVAPGTLSASHRDAAALVVSAMRENPVMVAGDGMTDTELTGSAHNGLVAKRGAEGLQCLGYVLDGGGYGVAGKVADGNDGRARVGLVVGIVRQLNLVPEEEIRRLTERDMLVVRNHAGREIGEVRPAFTLQRL